MICPYCGKPAKWCSNEERYGKRFGKSYMCYWCKDCDAYVGCHQNTKKPLGTMANAELRRWRMKAHEVLDGRWKSGEMSRKETYRMVSEMLGRTVHIGWSNIEECKEIIKKLT